jgi:hypothetical protein
MDHSQVQQDSQLFSIRLWSEELSDGLAEWRGEVRHLSSGETRYFREWPVLVEFLQDSLPDLGHRSDQTGHGSNDSLIYPLQ